MTQFSVQIQAPGNPSQVLMFSESLFPHEQNGDDNYIHNIGLLKQRQARAEHSAGTQN